MKGNKVVTKKKGFSILSFILGILLGIILIVGAVFGVGYFAATYDLDTVLKMAGLDNGKDEEGRNKYVNTDTNNGGVRNLWELVNKLTSMARDYNNLTLGQIDDLIPATSGLVDRLYASFEKYVQLDIEELSNVRFCDLGTYMQEVLMDIRPAELVDALNIQNENKVLDLVLNGVDSDYVEIDGATIPLYYDSFKINGTYERIADGVKLPASLDEYAYPDVADDSVYDVFLYTHNGVTYVARQDGVDYYPTDIVYQIYREDFAKSTGNYYIENGERIIVDPITVRTFVKDSESLNRILVTDLIATVDSGQSDDTLIRNLLDRVTLGSLMAGKVDLNARISGLEIGVLVNIKRTDALLAFLAFGVSNISSTPDENGMYRGVYKLGGTEEEVLVEVDESNLIKNVYALDGKTKMKGSTVGTITDVIDVIDISVLVDVNPENKILSYIAYGITGVTHDEATAKWTAMYGDHMCELTVSQGKIASVYDTVTGENVSAAGIDDLNDRVNGLTGELKIKDIVELDSGNKILAKLGDYTIDELSKGDVLNEIAIPDLIDVQAENSLIAYLAYGITEVDLESGTATKDGKQVYLTFGEDADGNTIITGVYSDNGHTDALMGTGINDINDVVNNLQSSVKIKDIIDIDKNDPLMKKIGEKTLNTVSEVVDELTIPDFMDVEADNALIVYLAYGITGVDLESGTATKDGETVYLTTDVTDPPESKVVITGVYTDSDRTTAVEGTTIDGINARVDGLTGDLKIGDLINMDENTSPLMKKLADYTIDELTTKDLTEEIELADVIDIEYGNVLMTYLAFGIKEITFEEGYYTASGDGGVKYYFKTETANSEETSGDVVYLRSMHNSAALDDESRVKGTVIKNISKQVDSLMDNVEIKYIVSDMDMSTPLMQKIGNSTINGVDEIVNNLVISDVMEVPADSPIMAYLGFGITEVKDNTAKYKDNEGKEQPVTLEIDEKGNIVSAKYNGPEGEVQLGTPVAKAGDRIDGLTHDLQIKYLIDIEPGDKLMEKIGEYTVANVGDVVNDLEVADVMKVSADSAVMAYLGFGITDVDKETKTAKYKDEKGEVQSVTLEIDEAGNIVSATYTDTEGEKPLGTKVNDINSRVDEMTTTLKIKDLVADFKMDTPLMEKIGNSTINGVGDIVNNLVVSDVVEIKADSKLMAYLGYGITDLNKETKTAKYKDEKGVVHDVTIVTDENNVITEIYYMDSAEKVTVPGTSVNKIGSRVDNITTDLKIKDIMDIDPNDRLMTKLGEYTVANVGEAIDNLEIVDVLTDIEAESAVMVYLAYGITGVDLESGTATITKDGKSETVYLDLSTETTAEGKHILKGVYTDPGKTDESRLQGTKINGISDCLDGLMNDLTLGELIDIDADNTIMNAIKDSTINGIGTTIDSLTLNELYYEEIYKQVIYKDNDEDGQADTNESGEMEIDKEVPAKLRIAVSAEAYALLSPDVKDNYITFSAAYLYYTKSGDGYTLVNISDDAPANNGKLTALPADAGTEEGVEGKTVYYTYGAPNSMWQLLLCDRDKTTRTMDEKAFSLNNIGSIISTVSSKLTGSTLRELDEAGIIDFKTNDLILVVSDDGKTLGDLELTDALSELIDLLDWVKTYQSWTADYQKAVNDYQTAFESYITQYTAWLASGESGVKPTKPELKIPELPKLPISGG